MRSVKLNLILNINININIKGVNIYEKLGEFWEYLRLDALSLVDIFDELAENNTNVHDDVNDDNNDNDNHQFILSTAKKKRLISFKDTDEQTIDSSIDSLIEIDHDSSVGYTKVLYISRGYNPKRGRAILNEREFMDSIKSIVTAKRSFTKHNKNNDADVNFTSSIMENNFNNDSCHGIGKGIHLMKIEIKHSDSFAFVLKTFNWADVIVMVHGAGVSNIAFAKPMTKVVEIYPFGFVKGVYKNLALIKNLKYEALYLHKSETRFSNKFKNGTREYYRQGNLKININRFTRYLQGFLLNR